MFYFFWFAKFFIKEMFYLVGIIKSQADNWENWENLMTLSTDKRYLVFPETEVTT